MRGLLDADILSYEFGGLKNADGDLIPLNFAINSMYDRIDTIEKNSKVSSLEYFLTGKDNFRMDVATIVPYKGHRQSEKPPYYKALRHELITNCNAIVVDGMEADDAVSIIQYNSCNTQDSPETAILSRDKDLNMVPGYHYGWEAGRCKERPLWWQDEVGGLRCFYKQLLTGDSTDNILGLFGVGDKSTLLKKLDDMNEENDMLLHVLKHYKDRFGNYAYQFMVENARLLWMLRNEDDTWLDQDVIRQIELDSLDSLPA